MNSNTVKSFQSYIVCTSPRSGSTLLCKLLAATDKAGYPDSHFHSPSISAWLDYYEIEADAAATEYELLTTIFNAVRDRGTSLTGIFGLRLQEHSLEYFLQKLRVLYRNQSSDSERIRAAFGKTLFIHLTRRNKLDQAISYVKATQTGLWHKAPDGTELERLSAQQEPVYDADAIRHQIYKFTKMDAYWDSWFYKEKVDPLVIQYELLSEDPIGVLGKLLDQLGLDRKFARHIDLPVAKLADETSILWARCFTASEG